MAQLRPTTAPFARQRDIVRRAFDLGVTHFDLANNYGPPPGAAEETFGRLLATDLRPYRDELVISTKAGYLTVARPVRRVGLPEVPDLRRWTSRCGGWAWTTSTSSTRHRFDPDTPLEETMGALDAIVRSGKALYVGVSNYSRSRPHGPPRSCVTWVRRC